MTTPKQKPLSKAEQRRAREIALASRPYKEPQYPPGPYIVDDTLTANGAELIQVSCLAGNTPNFIAAQLNLTRAEFSKLTSTNSKIPALRDALEKGEASYDSMLFRLITHRAVNGDAEAIKFLMRVKGWRESGENKVVVEGSRISINMPGAWATEAEFMAAEGQTKIIDARSPKAICELYTDAEGNKFANDDERDAYLKSLGLYDKPNLLAPPKKKDDTPTDDGGTPPPAPARLTPQNGMSVGPGFNRTTSY